VNSSAAFYLEIPMLRQELIAQGYRLVSRKYRLVARIDRPDWAKVIVDTLTPWMQKSIEENYNRAIREMEENIGMRDWYRRCMSKDTIKVSDIRGFPSSTHDPVGYVDNGTQTDIQST
jgi:hypothetical protein